ncbi:MAG: AAA family ATPase [Burkholderiaceae bacterium]|nr:AAA family ATPase [Burkholderiaceae bacterium]
MPPSRAAARAAARTPAPAAQVRLLGDPAVLLPGAPVRALERRAAGLLALAALEPGITRARAAALLWPDSDNARQALRQQIARFKRNYGAELIDGTDALFIVEGVVIDALQAGGGALLGSQSFDDCEDFNAWLAQQRAQRQGGAMAALAQQIAAAEAQGDLESAARLAEQLLLTDNDSEAHHRTLMRLHYLRGDIAQAQAVYERLARHLKTRFGAQPSAETEQLAQALRAARRPAAPVALGGAATRRPVPVTVLRPPRMIGRGRELVALIDAWQAGRTALLLGEPGLGKSRLLAEFAAGRRVFSVQGRPGDAGVPYATLARLLRAVLERAAIELPAPRRTELARLLPELAPSVPLPADGQRLLLQGAVEGVLAQAGIDGAPIEGLIVDDLHFADDASVEMLQALANAEALHGLRWALAQRPGEGSAAAATLRGALEEAQMLVPIALAPLTEAEMAELIDSLGLPELDSAQLAPQLARHTGGNPLFALETLKQGLASGTLQQGRLPTPVNVGALIERRLKQLSERALALARVAAVAGVDFSIALAEEVMGARAVDLADAWGELEAAQVLREDAFAHDLVYEAVLRSIPAAIARHLHAQAAQWLTTRSGEPARIAGHRERAGDRRGAADAYMEAGRAADVRLRFRESMESFERAAALYEQLEDKEAHFRARESVASEAALLDLDAREYDAIVGRLLAAAPDDAARAEAMIYGLRALEIRGDYEAMVRDAAHAVALARRTGQSKIEAYALVALGGARFSLQQLDQALQDWERVSVLGSELADPELEGVGHTNRGTTLYKLGHTNAAIAAFDRARAVLEPAQLWLRLALAEQQTAVVLAGSGKPQAALDAADRALLQVERLDIALDGKASFWAVRAMALRQIGRLGEAMALIEGYLPAFDAQQLRMSGRLRLELTQVLIYLGRADLARRVLAQALATRNLLPTDQQRGRYLELQLRALGRTDGKGDTAIATRDAAAEPRGRCELLRAAAALAPVSERAGLLDEALRLAQQYEFLDERPAAQALLAQHLHAAGQTHAAAELIRIAVADTDVVPAGYPPAVWVTAFNVLSAAGDPAGAARQLERASAWVESAVQGLPGPFRESFLQRNPVNRVLVQAARRLVSLSEPARLTPPS